MTSSISNFMEEGAPTKKRTRLNVQQSKNGCLTCKNRRIKCDETKPACLRCSRSKRLCAGYLTAAPSDLDISNTSSSSKDAVTSSRRLVPLRMAPPRASFYSITQTSEDHQFIGLAHSVLGHDPYGDSCDLTVNFRRHLLPQLAYGAPVVTAAATAFGAAYNSRLFAQDKNSAEVTAAKLYKAALRDIGRDLNEQNSGATPLAVACILLACTELLWRHPRNALVHLQGAINIVNRYHPLIETPISPETPSSTTSGSSSIDQNSRSLTHCDEDLSMMLRNLDLQSATYALGRPSDLPPPDFMANDGLSNTFSSVDTASARLVLLLHSCYHFGSTASAWKYMPPALIPRELLFEQGRHISRLSLWLKCLDDNILNCQASRKALSAKASRHVYMIRAQCLVTLIYISTVLSPYETTYDRYASFFQQIVENAEEVLRSAQSNSENALVFFRPGLGIIQPLLLTALKYRHSHWRWRAIALLERTGMEGPWVGRVETAVSKRVVQLEEASVQISSHPDESADIEPEQIAETKRICGANSPVERNGADTGDGMARICMSRCVDVEYMISGGVSFEDPQHWQIWEEDLYVGSIVPPIFTMKCNVGDRESG